MGPRAGPFGSQVEGETNQQELLANHASKAHFDRQAEGLHRAEVAEMSFI